jgi:hypothetical protein
LTLSGLRGTKERQVSSGSMKFDGVGESWNHGNQPICGRLLESLRSPSPAPPALAITFIEAR